MIREVIFNSPRNFALTILSFVLVWTVLSLISWLISLNYMRSLVGSESGFSVTNRAVVTEARHITAIVSAIIGIIEILLFLIAVLL